MDKWSKIPDELLLYIFGFLKETDLTNASCTCKKWRRVYNDPTLWRYRIFELSGYYRSQNDRLQRISSYITYMGVHLHHLRLSCSSPNLITAHGVSQAVKILLGDLTDLPNGRKTLRTFSMRHVNFDESWDSFRASKNTFVLALSHFLQAQGALRKVDLEDAFITPPFSYRILRAFSSSKSRSSLRTLNVTNYFCCDTPSRFVGHQIRTLLRRCWHLRDVSLNYFYLHAAGVEAVCKGLSDTLQVLRLHIDVLDQTRTEIISSSEWEKAREDCPQMRVVLRIHCWPREPWSVIVQSMPLSEILLRGRQCWRSEVSVGSKLSRVMDNLSRYCTTTLEDATFSSVGVSKFCPPSQESLARFLVKCTYLRRLVFSESLMTQSFMMRTKTDIAKSTNKLFTLVKT